MAKTVSQILLDVGASIDQDTTAPTGTELTVRVQFCDRSQRDWADFYDWELLRGTVKASIAYSMTSLAVPGNFSKLASPLWDYSTGVDSPTKYEELNKPNDRFGKLSTDKYVYLLGNDVSGKSLQINPPLASGASIVYDYMATPSSLATISDILTCPSSQFISKRVEYYVLQSRSDPRFPTAKAESDDLLSALVEDEDTPSGGKTNRVPDWMRSAKFVPGID